MTTDASDDKTFHDYYVRQLKRLNVSYTADEFVNPHNPLWPQQSFDYPYGQAPEVDDLPPQEIADWEKYIGAYYIQVALGQQNADGTREDGLANKVVSFVGKQLKTAGFRVYPDLDDDTFRSMLCEGLFSKFLCELDDEDCARFGLPTGGDYLKCDVSCMQVIHPFWQEPSLHEYVAPAVAVVQRVPSYRFDNQHGYQLFGIDIWQKDRNDDHDGRVLKPPFTSDNDKELWRRAKYFVLQGCLHRINMIDHIKVHFPHDTVNAITKSVLPKWHLVYQLLLPHFWLTLPVNNAVLEGDRSLINRDTWYPWSPLTAKGDEVRKLLPYSWAGSEYYDPGKPNKAYPPYSFAVEPFPLSSAGPASLYPSWYVDFQAHLYDDILKFVKTVCGTLGTPPTDLEQVNIVWLEIRRWAHEISRFLPGFPDEDKICEVDALPKVITKIIWNASVAHSFDHAGLHKLMDDQQQPKPMPFVMRVPLDAGSLTVQQALGDDGMKTLRTILDKFIGATVSEIFDQLQKYKGLLPADAIPADLPSLKAILTADNVLSRLKDVTIPLASLPLCSPADVLYAKMTDYLFYLPHNSSLLYDCSYDFDSVQPLTDQNRDTIRDAIKTFQSDLDVRDQNIHRSIAHVTGIADVPAPYVRPPDALGLNDADKARCRVQQCIAAGIQY